MIASTFLHGMLSVGCSGFFEPGTGFCLHRLDFGLGFVLCKYWVELE